VAAEGERINLRESVGSGEVIITENVPHHWIVTWLPPVGHPDYPGATLSSSLNSDMPTEGGAAALLAWARERWGGT
jgi:hypothetical protein